MNSNNIGNISYNSIDLKDINQQWGIVDSLKEGESLGVDKVILKSKNKGEADKILLKFNGKYEVGGKLYSAIQFITKKLYYGDEIGSEISALKQLAEKTNILVKEIKKPQDSDQIEDANRCYREIRKLNKNVLKSKKSIEFYKTNIENLPDSKEKIELRKQLEEVSAEIDEISKKLTHKIDVLNTCFIQEIKPYVMEIVGNAFGKNIKSVVIPQKVSTYTVKTAFSELFGKHLTKKVMNAYGLKNTPEINQDDIIALIIGVMANMTYEDLQYISSNREALLKATGYEFFRTLPDVNESNAIDWIEAIRNGFTNKKFVDAVVDSKTPPPYNNQLLKDISVIKSAQSFTHYQLFKTVESTDQYIPTVRKFGISEYLSKEIAPAFLSIHADTPAGTLIPIQMHGAEESTALVASVRVLGNKNGVGAILVKPVGDPKAPYYVAFHVTTQDVTSRAFHEQIKVIKEELMSQLKDEDAHVICMGDKWGSYGAGCLANLLAQDAKISHLGVHAFEGCLFDPHFSAQFVRNVDNNKNLQSVEIENFENKGSTTMFQKVFLGQSLISPSGANFKIYTDEDLEEESKPKISFNLHRVFRNKAAFKGGNSLEPLQDIDINSVSPVNVINKIWSPTQSADFYLKTVELDENGKITLSKEGDVNVQIISSSDEDNFVYDLNGTFEARKSKQIATLEHKVTPFFVSQMNQPRLSEQALNELFPPVNQYVPNPYPPLNHNMLHHPAPIDLNPPPPFSDNIIILPNPPSEVPAPPPLPPPPVKKTPEEIEAERQRLEVERQRQHYERWKSEQDEKERIRVSCDVFYNFVADEVKVAIAQGQVNAATEMLEASPSDKAKLYFDKCKGELDLALKGERKYIDINNPKNVPVYQKILEGFTNVELKLIAELHYQDSLDTLVDRFDQNAVKKCIGSYKQLEGNDKIAGERIKHVYETNKEHWNKFFNTSKSRECFINELNKRVRAEEKGIVLVSPPEYVPLKAAKSPEAVVSKEGLKDLGKPNPTPVAGDLLSMRGRLKKAVPVPVEDTIKVDEGSLDVIKPHGLRKVSSPSKWTDVEAEVEVAKQLNMALFEIVPTFGNLVIKESGLRKEIRECEDKLAMFPLDAQPIDVVEKKKVLDDQLNEVLSVRSFTEGKEEEGKIFIQKNIVEAENKARGILIKRGLTEDQINRCFEKFRLENHLS